MKRRVAVGIGAAVTALAVAGSLAVLDIGPLAIDTCVKVHENQNAGGDSMTICSTTPGNVKVANLTTRTDNLVNGCWRTINASSTWNDCISYTSISNLPSNYRLRFYLDANYVTLGYCFHTDGNNAYNLAGVGAERISSFRVEGGNC